MKKKVSALAYLLILPLLICISNPSMSLGKKELKKSLAITYVAEERLKVWGSVFSFGKFTLKNTTRNDIAFNVDASESYVIVDPRFVYVEKNERGSWHYDVTALEELEPPKQILILKPGAKLTFFVEMVSVYQGKQLDGLFRIVVRDNAGNSFVSEPFEISKKL